MFASIRRVPATNGGGVLLPLYLVLLGFFVVLYAISGREAVRTTVALDSIARKFGQAPGTLSTGMRRHAALEELEARASVQRVIAKFAARQWPSALIEVDGEGDEVRFRIPAQALFIGRSAEFVLDQTEAFQHIARLASAPALRGNFAVHVELGAGGRSFHDRRVVLASRRMAAIARELARGGLLPGHLMAAVAPAVAGIVTLSILRYEGEL